MVRHVYKSVKGYPDLKISVLAFPGRSGTGPEVNSTKTKYNLTYQ